jgi:hypothetical protein
MTGTNDLIKKVIESVIGGDEAGAEALARQALRAEDRSPAGDQRGLRGGD